MDCNRAVSNSKCNTRFNERLMAQFMMFLSASSEMRFQKAHDTEKEVTAAKQDLELLERLPAARINSQDAEAGIS